MKYLFCLVMFSFSIFASASETTFANIKKRVSKRDKITKAILAIDKHLQFNLTIKDNEAKVKIWRNMKCVDPNMENYTFKVTPEIRQEYKRLELQKELQILMSKCSLAERKFRVANYKKHKVFFNMPYKDAIKIFGKTFKDSGPRTLVGSYGLVSNEYIIEFRNSKLYDIQKK